jgi:hypothetical protein
MQQKDPKDVNVNTNQNTKIETKKEVVQPVGTGHYPSREPYKPKEEPVTYEKQPEPVHEPVQHNVQQQEYEREEILENSFEFLQPPMYDCPEVMRIREESGPFNYDEGDYNKNDGLHREKRKLVTIDNEANYQGEWVGNVRDGRGFQIWPDGSLYEGYWK